MKSKKQFPLIVFIQRSENDLQTELNLLRQAKKSVAKLLNQYVDAVNSNRQGDVLVLGKAYEEVAKAMFSGSSEIPSIRVSCGLDPIPAPLPEAVVKPLNEYVEATKATQESYISKIPFPEIE